MYGNDGWKAGDPIGYINACTPDFELPPYEGIRYEALVPDTLDLQERARLALNALTEVTDPLADYEVYWVVFFRSDPPFMIHNSWDATPPKFMLATSLMRLVSGSEQNLHVEKRWMETALKCQGPDGLLHKPVRGRPWAFSWFPSQEALAEARSKAETTGQIRSPFSSAAMLSTMSHLAKRDDSRVWRDALLRMTDGMIELAVDAGEIAYFWPSVFTAATDRPADTQLPSGAFECESSIVVHGLVHAYRLLGYEPALALARKFIELLRRNFYAPDGSFISSPGNPWKAHFHAHARGLLAMQEYAETAEDQELMEFVLLAYERVKDLLGNHRLEYGAGVGGEPVGSADPGAGLMGFFPEWARSDSRETCETCPLSDMIALALRLSEAGVADRWDDADRWLRNQLAEAQLTHTEWVYRLPKDVSVQPYSTTERVPERNLGCFAGCSDPNDWYPGFYETVTAHCCTVNGSKALYWIWDRILRHQDGKLRVNLLLNRASPWVDIDSYIPYQGRVDIRIKKPLELQVRMPEWVSRDEIRCRVNGAGRTVSWEGRYVEFGSVKPGDVAMFNFPIFNRIDRVHIEKQSYTLLRRGNEVVSIDPVGR